MELAQAGRLRLGLGMSLGELVKGIGTSETLAPGIEYEFGKTCLRKRHKRDACAWI
jgi:hypothetical protein